MRLGIFAAALSIATIGLSPAFAVEPAGDVQTSAASFLKGYCVACHGPEVQEAGLRLDILSKDFGAADAFPVWVTVFDRLQAGDMPPKAADQPTTGERREIVDRLRSELTAADLKRREAAGRAAVRRLNRTEYEYTLRDLFDLPAVPIREILPEDGNAFGYNKVGDALELSHVQLAKYMEATDLALDAATASQIEPPEVVKIKEYPTHRNGFKINLSVGDAVLLTKDFQLDESILPLPGPQGLFAATSAGGGVPSLEERAVAGKKKQAALKVLQGKLEAYQGSVGFFRCEGGEFNPHFHDFTAHAEGLYRIRLSLWSFTWNKKQILPADRQHVVQLRAGPKAKERYLGYFDVKSLEPTVIDTVVRLHPGEQIGYNGTSLRPFAITGPGGRAEWVGPGLAVDWMEVEGPLYEQWPPESHRRAFGDLPLEAMDPNSPLRRPDHSLAAGLGVLRGKARGAAKKRPAWTVAASNPQADAEALLGKFLPRAFRRPVTAEEIAAYAAIVRRLTSEDLTFEDAMRWAYKTALCSSDFLFLAEPPGKLNDYALASRLSYFLWNSLPDDALLSLAEKNRLHEPAELRRQVERMLQDPKAERFVEDFLDQWLDLQEIDATTPDRKLYPEFSPYLRDSMLAETRGFFRSLLQRDLSVTNLVDSNFTLLNERLALHYGIAGVVGSQLREVQLPPNGLRGGVLTQAALLKVTANGTTTTPVKRGAWVLREIVGQPPNPPPPNVPAVEPDINGATTIRQQLDLHRNNAACASCHAKIDPPGFALEGFDVIGGSRTRYRSLGEGDPTTGLEGRNVAYLLAQPVDTAGQWSDGRKFDDVRGLKRILLQDPELIARNVIRQLLVYSTGAEVGFADRAAVDEILDRSRSSNFGLRTILHEVVQSKLFLEK
jgi:mono/diheme cytochrome c family protein